MKKGVIVHIGTFDENGLPALWTISDADIGIEHGTFPDSAYKVKLGGYTVEELRDIYDKHHTS